jgi:lipopolysaccharide biosynthesis glycosyltransferase
MPRHFTQSETVSIVFAANDHYAPYLSTLFASIIDHSDEKRTYELIVLSEDLNDQHLGQLREQVTRENVSLRRLDVAEAMKPYEGKLRTWAHFKRETYFRLLLPQILPDHHKVLYLDADMICLHDVAPLYDTDVEGYLVAACKDPDTTGIYNGIDIDVGQPNKRDYMDNVLKIKQPYDYFQAGTIVFNLDEWRASLDVDEVFRFAQSGEWQLLDQDILNYFCQGRVRFLDMAWNVMFDNEGSRIRDIISKTTPELFEDYMTARKNPFIVHYAGPIKPWDNPDCDFSDCFWRYARISPFYETIQYRMYRQPTEQLFALLENTRDWIQSVDDELKRYEQRSAGLMLKEFVYQKVFTPLVACISGGDEERQRKIHDLYRKVHPERDA